MLRIVVQLLASDHLRLTNTILYENKASNHDIGMATGLKISSPASYKFTLSH